MSTAPRKRTQFTVICKTAEDQDLLRWLDQKVLDAKHSGNPFDRSDLVLAMLRTAKASEQAKAP